jgi:hypothetical protein
VLDDLGSNYEKSDDDNVPSDVDRFEDDLEDSDNNEANNDHDMPTGYDSNNEHDVATGSDLDSFSTFNRLAGTSDIESDDDQHADDCASSDRSSIRSSEDN